MSPLMIILIVAASLIGVVSLVYGLVRRFSRMSWIAWQIPIVFALTLLVRFLPETSDSTMQFVYSVAAIVGATVLIVGGGGLIRTAMLKKKKPVGKGMRILDRLLGAITAILDYAVLALILASVALPVLDPALGIVPDLGLSMIYENSLWTNFFAEHAFDFFLVTVFVLSIRNGWRVGFMRTLVIFIMLALTFGAVAISFYATLRVSLFATMASAIAKGMSGLHPLVAQTIGVSIISLVLFIVIFTIICLIFYFIVKLIRNIRHSYFWGTIDGIIGAVLAFAIALAITLAIGFGFQYLGTGNLGDLVRNLVEGVDVAELQDLIDFVLSAISSIEELCSKIATIFTTSPLSNGLLAIMQTIFPAA